MTQAQMTEDSAYKMYLECCTMLGRIKILYNKGNLGAYEKASVERITGHARMIENLYLERHLQARPVAKLYGEL